jgi:hypothetical protein
MDESGALTEMCNAFIHAQLKQQTWVVIARRVAIEEDESAARRQAGDQPVPHHPSAGSEVKQPATRNNGLR